MARYNLTTQDPVEAERFEEDSASTWSIDEQEIILQLARGDKASEVAREAGWSVPRVASFSRRHDVQKAVFAIRSVALNEFHGTIANRMKAVADRVMELALSRDDDVALRGCKLALDVLRIQDQREAVEGIWQLQKKLEG